MFGFRGFNGFERYGEEWICILRNVFEIIEFLFLIMEKKILFIGI